MALYGGMKAEINLGHSLKLGKLIVFASKTTYFRWVDDLK